MGFRTLLYPPSRRSSPRRIVTWALAVLALAAFAAHRLWHAPRGGRVPPAAPAELVGGAEGDACPVLHVTDGDTIHVRYRGADTKIRLLRINTPERGQPGAAEATEALRQMLAGRAVTLEFETPGREEHDVYERLLAYVILDGRNVNVAMVGSGWTRFWTKYGEGRYAAQFREAEREARAARRGLWATP